jgi:HlyD family secretion protein
MNIKPVVIAGLLLCAAAAATFSLRSQEAVDGALTLYGNVDIREVDMAFRQGGRLTAMVVEEGDAVTAGQLLAEVDAQPFADALAAADAEVLRARAELARLQAGNRAQEVERAAQDVAGSRAQWQRAEADLQRQTQLHADAIASDRTLETARAARDEAAARLAAAEQTASLLREGARSEDIAAAEARLAVAVAQQAQARTALADTRLLAPADALVASRVREPGSMVSSRESVYLLSLTSPVFVRAYVGEPQLAQAVPGREVSIRSGSGQRTYRGQIGFVSPRAEFTPKSVESEDLRADLVYRLRVVVLDADEGLRQGMPVTLEFGPTGVAQR